MAQPTSICQVDTRNVQLITGARAINASDSVDDPNGPFRGLYVTGAGTATVVLLDGTTLALNVAVNNVLNQFVIRRVNSTGLTAGLVGLV